MAAMTSLSQTVQVNILHTNSGILNLRNDMSATIAAQTSKLQHNMDEGIASFRTEIVRRDNDFADVKKIVSNLVEGLRRVEEEKKSTEVDHESKKRKRAE